MYDPNDPVGRLLFTVLSMIAEFEADLTSARTKEGMKVARAKGWLRGRSPKLSAAQEAHLVKLNRAGEHTGTELCELFGIGRATLYRAVHRAGSPGIGPDLPTVLGPTRSAGLDSHPGPHPPGT